MSGGRLAVLDSEEERAWLRRHLVKHVASNICGCQGIHTILTPINCTADPYETVTFLVGGHVDGEGTWVWSTGGEVGEADTCPGDHYSGACLGITWNQQLGCRSGCRQSSFLLIMFIMVLSSQVLPDRHGVQLEGEIYL